MLRLTDVPRAMAQRGLKRLEICHFHLNRHDKAGLAEMSMAMRAAHVAFQTLLIDNGDLSDPENHARDLAWIKSWIDVAADMGAEQVRVIAGKQKADAASLALAVSGLRAAAEYGRPLGVRVITENWFDLLATPEAVEHVLGALDGEIGFLADTGNWRGPEKFAGLNRIFAHAGCCHAKASVGADFALDEDDFGHCLAAAARSNFRGPYTLIYDGTDDDEWQGIVTTQSFIESWFTAHDAEIRAR